MKIIDRYLIREFLKTMLLALVSFVLLFILVDVFEKLDIFIDAKAKAWMVAFYYLYQIPYILVLTLPVAMLLASMGTISQMSRNYEIVALKSSGISLNRIFMPLLVLGLLVSLLVLGFGETVVPFTNQKRATWSARISANATCFLKRSVPIFTMPARTEGFISSKNITFPRPPWTRW